MSDPGGAGSSPHRLALLPLIPLLCLVPPEVHGLSQAGAAVLIALAAAVAWAHGETATTRAVAAIAALALPFVLLAPAPAAAVAPLALVLLAAGAGLAGAGAPAERDRQAALFAVTAAIAGSYGLWQRFAGLDRLAARLSSQPELPDGADLLSRVGSGRAFGTLTTPAALGGLSAMALPVTAGLALASRGRMRVLWMALCAVQLGALVASASATAAAALLLALALTTVAGSRTRRRLLAAAAVVVVVLAAIVALRDEPLLNATDPDSPWRLRGGNFRSAAAMALDHPWIGVGPGGFAEHYPAYRREGDNETRHVHNLPLEWVAEFGIPAGLVLAAAFFALFLAPLARGGSTDPPVRRGLAVGLAVFALQNLGDYTAFMPSLTWSAALLLGLTLGSDPGRTVHAARQPASRLLLTGAACGMALVLAAAFAAAAAGLSRDARFDARLAAWRGQPDEAAALASRAVRLAAWEPDAALFLARAAQGGDPAALGRQARFDALLHAERAVELAPMRAAARETRARARLLLGDGAGAFADLAEAARLYPLDPGYAQQRDALGRRIDALASAAEAAP